MPQKGPLQSAVGKGVDPAPFPQHHLPKSLTLEYDTLYGVALACSSVSLVLFAGFSLLVAETSELSEGLPWFGGMAQQFGGTMLGVGVGGMLSLIVLSQTFSVFRQSVINSSRLENSQAFSASLFSVETTCLFALVISMLGNLVNLLLEHPVVSTSVGLNSILITSSLVSLILFLKERSFRKLKRKLGFTLVDNLSDVNLLTSVGGRDVITRTDIFSVKPGDVFRVSAGTLIPLDGVVVSGTGEVEERIESGRSKSVIRDRGQKVFAGSRLSTGSVDCRVVNKIARSRICRHGEHFEKLIQSSLAANQEEINFSIRAVQLIWLASVFGACAMLLRGAGLLLAAEVAASSLLILAVPLSVCWFPVIRAAVITGLFKKGSLLRSVDALERCESVDSMVSVLPGNLFSETPPENNCSWQFIGMDLLDERYDENSLKSVLISLLGHSAATGFESNCVETIYQALRGTNPQVLLFSVKDVVQHSEACMSGTLENAPLIFGDEAFLLSRSVFIQESEIEDSPAGERLVGKPVTFLFAIGGEVVARIRMEKRSHFRGVEVGKELTRLGVRFSLLSRVEKPKADAVGRFFNLELTQIHGGMSDEQILDRLQRSEDTAFFAPELSSSVSSGLVVSDNIDEPADVWLLQSGASVLLDVFKTVKAGGTMRLCILLSGIVMSFSLFLALLFQVMSLLQVSFAVVVLMTAKYAVLRRFVRQNAVW